MKRCVSIRFDLATLVCCLLVIASVPLPAHAYIGPGAGITAIGSLLALLAALALAIVGFIWYPLKRLRKRSKLRAQQKAGK